MPVSEGHAEVTDRAGPAGPEPDQPFLYRPYLSYLSAPAGLDLMKCRLVVDGVSYN